MFRTRRRSRGQHRSRKSSFELLKLWSAGGRAVDLLKQQRPNVGEYWSSAAKQIQSYTNGDDQVGTTWQYQYFALKAGADYVNAEDTRRNVPLPFTPPLRGLLRATYQDRTYMGTIETRFAARQARLGDGDTPTAGYAIVNLGFGVRLARQRLVNNISVHCDNVFNQVYRDNLSVLKDFIPQPARGFRLNYQAIY